MPKVQSVALCLGGYKTPRVDPSVFSTFPGSLLHTMSEHLKAGERDIKVETDWMTCSLLDALLAAYTTGQLLVPEGTSAASVWQLADYANLPPSALPLGIRRNLDAARELERVLPKLTKAVLDWVETSAGSVNSLQGFVRDEAGVITIEPRNFEDLHWLSSVRWPDLTKAATEALAKHAIKLSLKRVYLRMEVTVRW